MHLVYRKVIFFMVLTICGMSGCKHLCNYSHTITSNAHSGHLFSAKVVEEFLKKEWSSDDFTSGSKYNESLAHLIK